MGYFKELCKLRDEAQAAGDRERARELGVRMREYLEKQHAALDKFIAVFVVGCSVTAVLYIIFMIFCV